ncbi:MAG TPA: helix-hairpin-helix domain-containing protein, partial [Polyangiaceae bacterium]|nr:helix-hairpin-helix domain-containing protein [Polyangiaceae bacterium]
GEAVGERDKLLLIPGMTERTADALGEAGYATLESVLREDPDRLAIKAGLGAKKAQALQQAARTFAEGEWPQVEAARVLARQQAAHAAQQPKAEGGA